MIRSNQGDSDGDRTVRRRYRAGTLTIPYDPARILCQDRTRRAPGACLESRTPRGPEPGSSA
eukprot:686174-Hanusia_phi.AAC.1